MIPPGPTPNAANPDEADGDPLPELIQRLGDTDLSRRLTAIADLASLGPLAGEAMSALESLLAQDNSDVRAAAARALGRMGAVALEPLTRALAHSDKQVRRQAIWALARMGPQAESAIGAISTALSDADTRTAAGAAQALANIGPAAASAVEALVAALHRTNLVECRLVSKALSQIGSAALPALLAELKNGDHVVQREIAVAIGFMGQQAAEAVGPIVEYLRSIAPEAFPRPQERRVPDESESTPLLPADSLPSETADIRIAFIEALARIGPAASSAREYLLSALSDPDRRVSSVASQALLRVMGWS